MPAKAPLRAAVERNNLSKATTLLRAGNLQSEENSDDEAASLLVAAMARGHLSMVGVLLDAGATSRPGEGAALLVGAIKADTKEGLALVAPLLRVVDADAVNGHVREWTPLMHAAKVGHVPTAEALLAAGADPTLRDVDGQSAADWAAHEGHDDLAEKLGRATEAWTGDSR